jgi:hypothetical protein
LYGPPGVLKTTLLAQLPKPLLFLDFEGGAGWLQGVDLNGIDFLSASDSSESATQACSQQLLQAARSGRYRSVAVDSLNSIRQRELDRLANGLMPDQGQYGLFNAWLGRVLMQSQFFPQIVLWTGGVEEQVDSGYRVLVPGGLSANNLLLVNQLLDAVIYAGWKQRPNQPAARFLTTEPVDPQGGRSKILVKDRTGLLPGLIEVPEQAAGAPMPDMAELVFGRVFQRLAAGQPTRKEANASENRAAARPNRR